MSVLIADDILQATQISEIELKREISILLLQRKKLGLSKARELAEMPLLEFQQAVYDEPTALERPVPGTVEGQILGKSLKNDLEDS